MTAGLWVALVGGVMLGWFGSGLRGRLGERGRRGKSRAKRAGRKLWNWAAAGAIVVVAVWMVQSQNVGA